MDVNSRRHCEYLLSLSLTTLIALQRWEVLRDLTFTLAGKNLRLDLSSVGLIYLNLENPYSHNFWNRDQYTARNRFVLDAVYDLPFGRARRFMAHAPRIVDGVLGGWRMTWITLLQGGQYFSPSYSGSDQSNTNTSGGLPNRIADGNLPGGQRTVARFFDASAFVAPPKGQFGNSGVNILQGPGMALHDLSLIKEFKITERWRVQLQALALDLFNTPTFTFPYANISVPGQVGQLYALQTSGDPSNATLVSNRSVILRLRVEF